MGHYASRQAYKRCTSWGWKQDGHLSDLSHQCKAPVVSLRPPSAVRTFSRASTVTGGGKNESTSATVHSGNPGKVSSGRARAPATARKPRPTRREAPSKVLLSALADRGYEMDIPNPHPMAVDYSYVTPKVKRGDLYAPLVSSNRPKRHSLLAPRLTYATILAKYISYVDPVLQSNPSASSTGIERDKRLDEAILKTFDNPTLEYLSKRGYTVEDVMSWAWILTAKDVTTSVSRYAQLDSSTKNSIPPFIYSFTLRRSNINAKTVGLLVMIAIRLLRKGESKASSNWERSGDDASPMIMLLRLLRAARQASPPAIPSIADIFTSVYGSATIAEVSEHAIPNRRKRLTQDYNEFILKIARPCLVQPYRSIAFQHRAIFQLLREMMQFKPPLVVTRIGYQAIVKVLAARPKTAVEREWADFKAPSWPPWKKDKLGIDAERGNEGSKSMTMKAIRHMSTSGYGMTRWEEVASIVGGWDTDGTPTIQTRTILPMPNRYRTGQGFDSLTRIRATRTLKEAWACFLAFKRSGVPPHQDLYVEMVEKLIFHKDQTSGNDSSKAMPGDGKEVFPEPSSPRDVIYVHTEPPSLSDFIQEMLSSPLKFSRKLLVTLLTYAPSFEIGMECLTRADLPQAAIVSLTQPASGYDPNRRRDIHLVSDDIFVAFIGFLGRFYAPRSTEGPMTEVFPIAFYSGVWTRQPNSSLKRDEALVHIDYLMRLRTPKHPRAWSHFLCALNGERIDARSRMLTLGLTRVIIWKEVLELLRQMQRKDITLNMEGFQLVCESLEMLIRKYSRHKTELEERLKAAQNLLFYEPSVLSANPHESVLGMVLDGVNMVKRLFYQMLFPQPPESEATSPPLIPAPALIHRLARVLGLAGDDDGLLALLRWMRDSETDLKAEVEDRAGGEFLMRRAIVVIRLSLEGVWRGPLAINVRYSADAKDDLQESIDGLPAINELSGSPDVYLQEARNIIEKSELFSPWPTDEELQIYLGSESSSETAASSV